MSIVLRHVRSTQKDQFHNHKVTLSQMCAEGTDVRFPWETTVRENRELS